MSEVLWMPANGTKLTAVQIVAKAKQLTGAGYAWTSIDITGNDYTRDGYDVTIWLSRDDDVQPFAEPIRAQVWIDLDLPLL